MENAGTDTAGRALTPLAFEKLDVGDVRPRGWLRNQLRIQADGLSGHLDEFWYYLRDSAWIGGPGEGWEGFPYFLDGLVPLAFILDDERLKSKVDGWLDTILSHQHEDGWIGPRKEPPAAFSRKNDPWGMIIIGKVLTQYHEATSDPRIIPALRRLFKCLSAQFDREPLANWAAFRASDLVVSLYWLYDRCGESWILELATKVVSQAYDWTAHFADFKYPEKLTLEETYLCTHVVNNAMGIKYPGMRFRLSGETADAEAVHQILGALDEFHGQVTGLFSGDEHYAGKSPSQGTELCAVVEYMFSLENLVQILGDVPLADRLERIAFNALPAALSPDMWSHQYDQQANQVVCKVSEERVYVNNGPDANIFGLMPECVCCTSNMHQGWPKFAAHLWMRSCDGGLAAIAYAPCEVCTRVADIPVQVRVQTDYPFDERVEISVEPDRPLTFPLHLRIPGWCRGATVQIGNGDPTDAKAGSFHVIERNWEGATAITLNLTAPVNVERRYNGAAAILRGPLVYSLAIGEDWRRIMSVPASDWTTSITDSEYGKRYRDFPLGDWEVHPTSPWNYALAIDLTSPEQSIRFQRRAVRDCPFSPAHAPIHGQVKGRRVPQWTVEHNAAAPPPKSPVRSSEPLEWLLLLPYGCTALRISEFPVLE